MNILLLGGGGREHALAWKLAQSPSVERMFAAPGNPGIARHAEIVALDLSDHAAVIGFCRANAIDLVVVGPEGPLVDGICDSLRAAGIAAFGPSKAAARLEGSKAFTKALCDERGIPTARYEHHDTLAGASAALDRFGLPVVVKADGLAAGKGVTVAMTRAEAEAALSSLFDAAGAEVVIEEFLSGEEVSLFALTDGTTVVPFTTAQDHKRIGEGDTGPNTGGMGAYSPATILTDDLQARAMAEIVVPTVEAMRAWGTPFIGVLYAGLILTENGPKLIEYNVRFGDPETQAMLPRFDGDLALLLDAVARGRLAEYGPLAFTALHSMTVVVAAPNYPSAPRLGDEVRMSETDEVATFTFIAGLERRGDMLLTSGGRVLAVTALGDNLVSAGASAYRALSDIDYPAGYYRRDIGAREMLRGHSDLPRD